MRRPVRSYICRYRNRAEILEQGETCLKFHLIVSECKHVVLKRPVPVPCIVLLHTSRSTKTKAKPGEKIGNSSGIIHQSIKSENRFGLSVRRAFMKQNFYTPSPIRKSIGAEVDHALFVPDSVIMISPAHTPPQARPQTMKTRQWPGPIQHDCMFHPPNEKII